MSRHTRGSRQDIHSTRVPPRRKAVDGSPALSNTKSPNHHNGHQHGSGARDHDHGTTTHSTVDTAGDQPKNWRATIPMTGGRRPENRHDRYSSRNAGDVHDGTGDQASSDVTLRQQPVSVPSNRRFPLSGCTDRCAFSNEQDDARRRVDCVGRL